MLRPIWIYALPVWGCTSNSLQAIIQLFQNESLHAIVNAPWYVRNDTLYYDLRIPTVKETIISRSTRHERCLHYHSNPLALELLDNLETIRRLYRCHCADLLI